MVSYDATTDAVTVTVRPVYLDDRSDVLERRFVHLYFVQIENDGPLEIQLLRRRWLITDADGHVEEVEGEGVEEDPREGEEREDPGGAGPQVRSGFYTVGERCYFVHARGCAVLWTSTNRSSVRWV